MLAGASNAYWQARQTTTTRLHLDESFHQFDDGGKGWLSRSELKFALASMLGYKPSKVEVDIILQRCPEEGRVEVAAFRAFLEEKLSVIDPDDRVRQLFKAFDVRCLGFIGREDLHKVFAKCLPSIQAAVIDEIFEEVDTDYDGRVSCRDFEAMLRGRIL
mmetsp:Transcript_2470/g.4130  ORF Transcript_2470/g.4130 Transcript_2470/m.4130 type:complete len:160 (+) Transcript_2470:332-811(+)|eukprot:CAMPEP_0198201704 /NCGR_PEP_ID=MMETSP1445-20131203/4675_1 /TAXON_ID=36898 /ORGANISM="Pyramimonas sp., Strain CCMP2087" /LENGTH=159 /DNA_ID=CAMNT_0043872247 /DNA_START=330 /DNA_END=809 /DNA_ORIENTATION=-